MNKDLENACVALDALATAVTNAWAADVTACESFGWFAPAVTRHDLADLAKNLAADIRSTESESVDPAALKLLQDVPHRLQVLLTSTVPQMFGGNGGQAIPAYISTLGLLRTTLLPAIGWQVVLDQKALPSSLVRRARAAPAELDQLYP